MGIVGEHLLGGFFAEDVELAVQDCVLGLFQKGVVVEDVDGGVAGGVEDGGVFVEVGDFEVDGEAALAGAFDVSGTSHFEVFFGELETVVGGAHEFDSLAGFFAEFITGH